MTLPEHTPPLALLQEAVTVPFCPRDDAYYRLNPQRRRYEALEELSDSEVITLALFRRLLEAWSPSVPSSCANSPGSSRTRSPGSSWVFAPPPRPIAASVRRLRRYFEPLRGAPSCPSR